MPESTQSKINLDCGEVFVSAENSVNLDYSASDESVMSTNLLGRLPLPDGGASLVYCSHFLEHIPRDLVAGFLKECFKVLSPGSVIQLVLPDLQELCRAHLSYRYLGEHEKANFIVIQIVDQCVRRQSGGELGRLYRKVRASHELDAGLVEFIRERNAENLLEGHLSQVPLSGGGGDQICRCATTARPYGADLDTCRFSFVTQGFQNLECQFCWCRRASPLVVGLPTVGRRARTSRVRCGPAQIGVGKWFRRVPVPAAGYRHRRPTAQRCRINVYRGKQAQLKLRLHVVLHIGGRHD